MNQDFPASAPRDDDEGDDDTEETDADAPEGDEAEALARYRQPILDELGKPGYAPRRSKELARHLGVSKAEYPAFRESLSALKSQGLVARGRGGRWLLPAAERIIVGTIQMTRSGRGWLLPDDPALDEVSIGQDYVGHALNRDKVRVLIDAPRGAGFRHYGRVLEVLERASPRIVATINQRGKAVPEDPKNPYRYGVEETDHEVAENDKVLLEITVWPGERERPRGRIVEVLGPAGAPDTETAAILAGFEAPGPFPEAVKEAVRELHRGDALAERGDRLDLTKLVTVTIDPTTARDFDDALSYEVQEDGTIVVGVHIADVAHFVKRGGELDKEARERSTSIYLPERVIPMLPEELSNDLCSLRPEEDRFAKTVFLHYDPQGNRKHYTIHRSVIHSHCRMTYEEVKHLLTDEAAAAAFEDKPLLERLRGLNDLAQILRQQRTENEAIELTMPEFVVVIDENGKASDIVEVEHDFSHQLVENFMLSANVAVAEWCVENVLDVLHRVHEPPDEEAIEELAEFLIGSGYVFKPPFDRRRLNQVLRKAQGRPDEHAINLAVLKSFKQAVYAPRTDVGHFALNFRHYTHFTSPIRRYPDCYLHQALDGVWPEGKHQLPQKLRSRPERGGKALESLGVHASGRERRAMKIEEAVKDFRRLELLSMKEERTFTAVITGIRKFGIFVEIEDYYVEGFIPRWMVERGGFSTKEVVPGRRKKRHRNDKPGFHLGQEIRVKITNIDLAARVCEMAFLGLA